LAGFVLALEKLCAGAKKNPMMKKTLQYCLVLLTMLVLIGCNTPAANAPTVTPENAASQPSAEAPTMEIPTPVAAANTVVLAAPNGAYPQLEKAVSELAASAGLIVETRDGLQAGDLSPQWKVVVFPSAPANLTELASAAPQTQFVVASAADLTASENVSVIRLRPEYQAFTAGYLGVVLAFDFRTGALLPAEGATAEAFFNGGKFFCGLCNSHYSPIVRFPVMSQLPAGSAAAQWQQEATELQKNYLYVMYVSPEAATSELLSFLVAQGYTLYGGQTPPEEFRSRWAATVREDMETPLRALWPAVNAGQGGQIAEASVEITDVNPDLLSSGRLERVQKMVEDLAKGLIFPFNPPME